MVIVQHKTEWWKRQWLSVASTPAFKMRYIRSLRCYPAQSSWSDDIASTPLPIFTLTTLFFLLNTYFFQSLSKSVPTNASTAVRPTTTDSKTNLKIYQPTNQTTFLQSDFTHHLHNKFNISVSDAKISVFLESYFNSRINLQLVYLTDILRFTPSVTVTDH